MTNKTPEKRSYLQMFSQPMPFCTVQKQNLIHPPTKTTYPNQPPPPQPWTPKRLARVDEFTAWGFLDEGYASRFGLQDSNFRTQDLWGKMTAASSGLTHDGVEAPEMRRSPMCVRIAQRHADFRVKFDGNLAFQAQVVLTPQ